MKLFTSLLIFTVSSVSTMALAQITIFEDDFTDGLNPGYTAVTGSTDITVETSGTGLTGNALLINTTANNRTMVRGFGDSITLASLGDYVEISLDYRFTAALDDNFGTTLNLFSSSSTGGINFNPSLAANGGTYFTDSDSNSGRFDAIASGTTAQSLSFRITRSSATEVTMSSSFNGSPRDDSNAQIIGGVDGGTAIGDPLTFDTLELGWVSGNQGEIFFDNVTLVSNIPEPSSLALIAVALGGLALMRRRK